MMLFTAVVVLCSILALGQPLPSQWWAVPVPPEFQENGSDGLQATEGWAEAQRELETELGKLQAQLLNGVARCGAMAEHFNSQLAAIKLWEDKARQNMTAMMEAMQAVGERLARAEDGAREVNVLRHAFLETRTKQDLLIATIKQDLEKAVASLETAQGGQAGQLADLKLQVDAQVDVIKQQHEALLTLASLQKTVEGIQEELRILKADKAEMETSARN